MKNIILLTTIGLLTACGDSEPETPKKVEKPVEVKKEAPKAKAPTPKPEAKPEPKTEAPKAAPAADSDAAAVTVNADGVAELTIEANRPNMFKAISSLWDFSYL